MAPSKQCRGSVVSFHNISYKVDVKQACCGTFRKVTKKQILYDVSGIIKPGLNAIMGQTGSGKSSLLDVLANRKDPKWLSGQVLLNGKPLPKNFKYLSGYVTQNDLLVGTITVRETLWFCANLRLPNSVSNKEKRERIDRILNQLGLNSCAETKIGTDIIRGISGGEKKRTSIALELILEPQILFLHEPTTGLDAATAYSIMRLLKRLGNEGNTILCSIHQPRYSIYKLFDHLTLLSSGKIIYHGPGQQSALDFFQNVGYICEAHDNPANFFLDVLNGEHEPNDVIPDEGNDLATEGTDDFVGKIRKAYLESTTCKSIGEELKNIPDKAVEKDQFSERMYATSFLRQIKVLLGRTIKNTIRHPQALLGIFCFNSIIGIVMGLLYFQVDDTPKGVQNRIGVMFFITLNLIMETIPVIDTFTKSKAIYIHEQVSGYYSVISYYLAIVFADLLPLRTLPPVVFCTITYWMVGLSADAGKFFTFLFTVILLSYTSTGIGLLYSSSFQPQVARIFLSLTFLFYTIFTGVLVNVDSIVPWLSWLKYLSVARYGFVALSINELLGKNFTSCSENATSIQSFSNSTEFLEVLSSHNDTVCVLVRGEKLLHSSLSIGDSPESIDAWDLWQNHVALGVIITCVYILTYIQLLRTKKYS